jgi:hypothetical protein
MKHLSWYWLRNTLCHCQVYIRYFRSFYCLYDCFEGTNSLYSCIYKWSTEETGQKHGRMSPYSSSSSPNSELAACDNDQRRRKRQSLGNRQRRCPSYIYQRSCHRLPELALGLRVSLWISRGLSIQTTLSDNATGFTVQSNTVIGTRSVRHRWLRPRLVWHLERCKRQDNLPLCRTSARLSNVNP